MNLQKLTEKEYNPFYTGYIRRYKDKDIIPALSAQKVEFSELLRSIPSQKIDYSYEAGKWSIGQVLGHVLDAERVFAYRALCISRGEKQGLIGFDQDDYAINAGSERRNLSSFMDEFVFVRNATISLFSPLNEEQLLRMGKASGSDVSVRALGYIILGHCDHHIQILKDKYLNI